jgi:transcription initiation factor TFIID TATA-box-binding protein
MMTSKEKIVIQNIVLTIDLGRQVDLFKMYNELKDEYNIVQPDMYRFPANKIKTKSFTLMVYSTGKCVCAGISPKKDDILRNDNTLVFDSVLQKIKSILKLDGESLPEYRVQNVVSTTDLGIQINLMLLNLKLKGSEYEPEVFPAIIYKKNSGGEKIVFLIYHNGKVIIHTPKFKSLDFGRVYKIVDDLKKEINV